MRLSGLILLGLLAWTGIGLIGSWVAHRRGETMRFRRGLAWIGGGWAGYFAVLLTVSLLQPGKIYQPGQALCFPPVCLSVEGAEEVQGFWARGQERERLVRVAVRVRNRDTASSAGEQGLTAYLTDRQGRRWEPVPGLTGVPLSVRLGPRGSALSTPVFRVAKNATGLRLVLRHTRATLHRLTIGDPESWLHRPAELETPQAGSDQRSLAK